MKLDTNSETWKVIASHVEQRIAKLARSLESDQTETDTTRIRGQLKAFREVLALSDPTRPDSARSNPR